MHFPNPNLPAGQNSSRIPPPPSVPSLGGRFGWRGKERRGPEARREGDLSSRPRRRRRQFPVSLLLLLLLRPPSLSPLPRRDCVGRVCVGWLSPGVGPVRGGGFGRN
ncbi:hypothetical protein SEVIR_3G334850v4 [Setaria viridis]